MFGYDFFFVDELFNEKTVINVLDMCTLWKHIIGLFDLILYIPVNNFFSYVKMGLPGLNQY